jgi:hypothetical protein
MIEHTLGEGLAGGVGPELTVEAEGLSDGEVGLDREHGGSGALLFAEDLSTTLVQTTINTTDGVFRALNLNCRCRYGQSTKLHDILFSEPR